MATEEIANPDAGANDSTLLSGSQSMADRLFADEGTDEDLQPEDEELEPDEAQLEDEETGEPESEGDDEPSEWANLDELIAAGGADAANLTATVKIDGEELQVSVNELVQGYQREADYRRKSGAVAEERRQIQTEWNAKVEAMGQRETELAASAQIADQMVNNAEQQLQERYRHVDWAQLRTHDPAEYAAQWTEYQQQIHQTQQLRANVRAQVTDSAKKFDEVRDEAITQRRKDNHERLTQLMPQWAEPETAKTDGEAMVAYIEKAWPGTTANEMSDLDPRMLQAIHKARLYDELITERDEIKAKGKGELLRPVRPVAKSRSPKQLNSLKRGREFNALKQKAKSSGKVNDAAAALSERWR